MLAISGAMLTDVGRVRSNNEDSVLFSLPPPEQANARRVPFAVVADGMGGHNGGEVASALAVEILRQVMESGERDPVTALRLSLSAANTAIYRLAQEDPSLSGMGTTCTALLFTPDAAVIGHVGDSRAYRLRDGVLSRLTVDQTLVEELLRNGEISTQEAAEADYGNVLVQALGTRLELAPEIWIDSEKPRQGDVFLLCSDGLTGGVDDAAIAAILKEAAPMTACRRLIEAALAAGGQDNVSVGVFRIEAGASN